MDVSLNLTGDLSEALARLESGMKEHVIRSAAHAGATVLYEEARRLAPVYDGPERKGIKPGQLRNAIYHVFSDAKSGESQKIYEISWNAKKAPHGHLIERGHWRINKVVRINGNWVATTERLPAPVWVPAVGFIRRAYDQRNAAVNAMQTRAAERTAEVLAEIKA